MSDTIVLSSLPSGPSARARVPHTWAPNRSALASIMIVMRNLDLDISLSSTLLEAYTSPAVGFKLLRSGPCRPTPEMTLDLTGYAPPPALVRYHTRVAPSFHC